MEKAFSEDEEVGVRKLEDYLNRGLTMPLRECLVFSPLKCLSGPPTGCAPPGSEPRVWGMRKHEFFTEHCEFSEDGVTCGALKEDPLHLAGTVDAEAEATEFEEGTEPEGESK